MVGSCVGLREGSYVGNLVGLKVVGSRVGESMPAVVGVVEGMALGMYDGS